MKLDDLFDFGKYKGQTLLHVLNEDPSYLLWLREHYGTVSFDDQVIITARQAVDQAGIDIGFELLRS